MSSLAAYNKYPILFCICTIPIVSKDKSIRPKLFDKIAQISNKNNKNKSLEKLAELFTKKMSEYWAKSISNLFSIIKKQNHCHEWILRSYFYN